MVLLILTVFDAKLAHTSDAEPDSHVVVHLLLVTPGNWRLPVVPAVRVEVRKHRPVQPGVHVGVRLNLRVTRHTSRVQ